MDPPALGLERAAHARGTGEGVMNGTDRDPTLVQGPKDEGKKPRLVSDVPHDAKGARSLASPPESVGARN